MSGDLLPRDSHVVEPSEVRRLTGQNLAILKRLEDGPASARELAALSLKYTSRVSDLRKAGFDVRVREHHHGGMTVYYLRRA